jgi:hypothetical protein
MGSGQEDGLKQHSGEISLDPENHHIIEEDIIFPERQMQDTKRRRDSYSSGL